MIIRVMGICAAGVLAAFAVSWSAQAQKTPAANAKPLPIILSEQTALPVGVDPVVTGSTGLRAPAPAQPLNLEDCDATCQANRLGITFDE
ncbi:MAG: hypothetical protein AAFR13_02835 [Pseudomonadota bacterium]